MVMTVSPHTAIYKGRILFLNLSKSIHTIVDNDIYDGYDMCFMFLDHFIYVNLEPGLTFGVKEVETGDMFGPYDSHIQVITLHLFGKYDSLFKFLGESFVFNGELGSYEFIYELFVYGPHTFDFTYNVSDIATSIASFLPKIEEPFDYEFEEVTYFASGAIEEFLNKLNAMFRQGNFTETYKESDTRLIGLAPASSGVGVRRLDGSGFFVLNLSQRKHIKYYLAKEVPDAYISFTTDGSPEAELALLNEVTNGQVTIIENEKDVDYYKNEFDIDITAVDISIRSISLFNDVLIIIGSSEMPLESIIFIRSSTGDILPVLFNSFTKEYTIMGHDYIGIIPSLIENVSIKIESNCVIFGYMNDIISVPALNDSVIVVNESIHFSVDSKTNRTYSADGNIYAVSYAAASLSNIFK